MADLQKISQLVMEVMEATEASQKISQVVMEVAGTRIPTGLGISQVVMEVLYIEGEGAAEPTQDQLMRHGGWFSAGERQPFWWPI